MYKQKGYDSGNGAAAPESNKPSDGSISTKEKQLAQGAAAPTSPSKNKKHTFEPGSRKALTWEHSEALAAGNTALAKSIRIKINNLTRTN